MPSFNKISQYETRRVVQLGFSAVLILVLIYAIASLYQIRVVTNNLTKIVEISNAKVTHLNNMRDSIRQRQILLNLMLATKDPFLREDQTLAFFAIAGSFRQARETLEELPINDTERLILDQLIKLAKDTQPLTREAVMAIMEDFDSDEAKSLVEIAQTSQREMMDHMKELINLQKKYESQYVAESRKGYETTFFWSVLSAVLLISFAALISRIVSGYVSQKNKELLEKNSELERASQMALEATRTKSAFLATMSHEIRTPLTAIIGFAETNLEDDISAEDQKRHSQSIVRNGKHLLNVINDILDFSKYEADRIEFAKETFSPVQVVQEVEQIITPQARKKGLEISLSYDFPLPECIVGDALRLKQVVLNLCSNAVKFTETGRINIKTSCNFELQKLFIEVIDTGIGMTDEQVEKVFDVFTQADSSITRKYGGTGLGLTLSKQFAQCMGGTIEASSLIDIGSRFVISVGTGDLTPYKIIERYDQIPSFARITTAPTIVIKKVKGRVLLAEDNPDNQQLFTILLTKTGVDISIASNGQKAVEMAMANPYDLIYMDMQMPVMDGIEATKILRNKGYSKPIVALTANAMKQDRDACMNAGCNGFITKPINKQTFYNVLYENMPVVIGTEHTHTNSFDNDPDVIQLKMKFVENLPDRYKTIRSCLRQGDYEDARAELHKLKGLGGSLGCYEITTITGRIEECLEERYVSQCESLMEEMHDIIDDLTNRYQDFSRQEDSGVSAS